MKRKNIFLSQCMIVKNEEENIERALAWGCGIVDEQIVVDTGSTDRTVELARAAGAQVYTFPWNDDFSAAKNFAIEKAQGRWIAFLDADEYFTREDAKKMRSYIEKLDGGSYGQIVSRMIHINNEGNMLSSGTQIRIFVNAPYLRYRRRIHEYLFSTDPKRGKMTDAVNELTIFHTGYGKRENAKKNAEHRNLRLIEKELADHPDDCDMLGYLADEYYSYGENEKAEEAFRRSITHMPERISEYDMRSAITFTKLLELLIKANRPTADVLPIYEKARELLPKEADFDYLVGSYFMNREEWEKGREHLEQALSILEKNGSTAKSMMLSGQLDRAYEMLALCCFRQGDLTSCVRYAAVLLGQNRYKMQALRLLLSSFRQKAAEEGSQEKTAQAVLEFVLRLYDMSILKDRLFLYQGAKQAGYGELAEKLLGYFSKEELERIDPAATPPTEVPRCHDCP